jgi:endoglucanase
VTAIAAALASAIVIVLAGPSDGATPAGRALIRLNQVGYAPSGAKQATVLTARPPGAFPFTVASGQRVVFKGRSGAACPGWNARWRGCRTIDFSELTASGTYTVHVGGSASPPFRIGAAAALYGPLADHAVAFFQAQRDGPNVIPGQLHRRPSHLNDASASVYAMPRYRGDTLAGPLRATGPTLDVTGGWFDAGDYLKFTGTASFSDALMLLALRDLGDAIPNRAALEQEARFGTDWLLKTWDPARRVLYEQVGIGDGNGSSVMGDHDIWRLPERDDSYRARSLRYIAHRPVFAANQPGQPISPNLAGRVAAAFALCAQVFQPTDPTYAHRCLLAGEQVYDAGAPHWKGPLAASVPSSYYAEPEWRDDMELAATELFLAAQRDRSPDLPHRDLYVLIEDGSKWANSYMAQRTAGEDTLNIYDVAALAHFDLYRAMVASGHLNDLYTNAADLRNDLHDQLALGVELSRTGPLGLANPAGTTDTVPHALGYAIEARLFDALTGSRTYEQFARRQLDWVLGANPWGSSFVIGAGSVFPRCPSHQVANLSGSLAGRPPILLGGTVDGPTDAADVSLGAPDGFRPCSARAAVYRSLDARGFRYLDDVRSASTSEPSDDYTALSLLAFAQQSAGPRPAPPIVAVTQRRAG